MMVTTGDSVQRLESVTLQCTCEDYVVFSLNYSDLHWMALSQFRTTLMILRTGMISVQCYLKSAAQSTRVGLKARPHFPAHGSFPITPQGVWGQHDCTALTP